MSFKELQESKIAIIGLGYVGLPLAIEFAKKYPTIGFDISESRTNELNAGYDKTSEIKVSDLNQAIKENNFFATTNVSEIKDCNIYIITVPTPIDNNKLPDLEPLISASELVAGIIKKNDLIIYESTVYPGATEDDCIPIIESLSGLTLNKDFFCGYSPERINPGDKCHTVTKIKKVTSGSNQFAAEKVNSLYKSIITAGTHMASSIRVAEAAKVIENSQRDLNIAFVNELAIIFNKMGINTNEVLDAASTKWNFLPFKPGLVGGHCIGIDPYYLTYQAEKLGYKPEIILAGRKLNDNMSTYVAQRVEDLMINNGNVMKGSKILILGVTFKENCPDIRNSKVIDLHNDFKNLGASVDVYDPIAQGNDLKNNHGISLLSNEILPKFGSYDALILAVPHDEFKDLDFRSTKKQIIFDIKGIYKDADASL